jgi:hypothetical protein
VARDGKIKAHDNQIGALLAIAEKHSQRISATDERLEKLLALTKKNAEN